MAEDSKKANEEGKGRAPRSGFLGGLLRSWTGKAMLIGLAVVLLGYAAKLYYDEVSKPATLRRSEQAEITVSKAVDNLVAHVDRQKEANDPLPANVGWTPVTMPCGQSIPLPANTWEHPTWKVLGIGGADRYAFQYRFRKSGRTFELLARTDGDCDGLHEVHRAGGELTWSGLSPFHITIDNPGE